VDNGADVTGKKLSHMKYFSKRSDSLRFYAYLCHVMCDLLVLKRSTKVSEKSDMTKSWATFCCSGTYKKSQAKVLRNLGKRKNKESI
ncbi:MAG: hypothetical protein J6X23_07340, partial [Bacteroidaceae bacterium]|nr:hypothetical protein [Bacteroidaceae bacterium]